MKNSLNTLTTLTVEGRNVHYFSLPKLAEAGLCELAKLPYSIRILLENLLRHEDGERVTARHVRELAGYNPKALPALEVPFMPSRVILQDFTGVPAVVDLAAMRDAMQALGGDPERINPLVRADLVIDHSVQVDAYGNAGAMDENMAREYGRNQERYNLLNWAQQSFKNFNVVPPGAGIIHQVNLENLATVVAAESMDGGDAILALPDSVVGTDSHTTMINGLGVMGWGVGGIEAEAVMLGQPYYMLVPAVVGVELTGTLPAGATATDLVLTITARLREKGVVGKFVEYFGPGVAALNLTDRAVLANMAPEYGATMGFFPVDDATLAYMALTGRSAESIALVEAYTKAQQLFCTPDQADPAYTDVVAVDLSKVVPCVAGPKRPQDNIPLAGLKKSFCTVLTQPAGQGGLGVAADKADATSPCTMDGETVPLQHGSVVIAALTSCTNTSNPTLMLAAGLVAKHAREKGLAPKPWVKTSLAPGSQAVTGYLARAGLLEALESQGFHVVGYGCTTCIGNSGPLPRPVADAIVSGDLVAASVVSGNRNFEGRIHPLVKANYLASPPLVVAYALSGRIDIDFDKEPMGHDPQGNAVFLKDLWPTAETIAAMEKAALTPDLFQAQAGQLFAGDDNWQAIETSESVTYSWDDASTYIKAPPFFKDLAMTADLPGDIQDAQVLALLGDSVTTDHISPAGAIPEDGPAGRYLKSQDIPPGDFNSFGSRRGNHEVMMRGTFANIRLKNLLVPGSEGGVTRYHPSGETMTIFEAAMQYAAARTPLIIIAGKEYGTGSSRDWAAKGTSLLGVQAVIAESFERIHRSNLIGMGVLPCQFADGDTRTSLGLTGLETYTLTGLADGLTPGAAIQVTATDPQGKRTAFTVQNRLDTPVEADYFRNGGILQTVLRMMKQSEAT